MQDKLIRVEQAKQLAKIYSERYPEKCNVRYPKFMTHNEMNYESDIL